MNQRQLAKILRESANPPSKGELAIILESGDQRYWTQRAIEYCKLTLNNPNHNVSSGYLKIAISLLAAARLEINEKTLKAKDIRIG